MNDANSNEACNATNLNNGAEKLELDVHHFSRCSAVSRGSKHNDLTSCVILRMRSPHVVFTL
jgi:hypothetical protein